MEYKWTNDYPRKQIRSYRWGWLNRLLEELVNNPSKMALKLEDIEEDQINLLRAKAPYYSRKDIKLGTRTERIGNTINFYYFVKEE